tara:strand:- start:603 stop:1178 length:576 start_codon:yes stop_codon:yes gene_type:complete
MSKLLYYSNYCKSCQEIIQDLAKSTEANSIHFINIDKRKKKDNGYTYVILENGQELLLPPSITRVPALMLLNDNQKIIFGDDIKQYVIPRQNITPKQTMVQQNLEPTAFSLGASMNNVMSDNYSFLDTKPDDLSAKGSAGLRQMHNYVDLNSNMSIETPADDYKPNTIGNSNEDNLENIMKSREADISIHK